MKFIVLTGFKSRFIKADMPDRLKIIFFSKPADKLLSLSVHNFVVLIIK